MKIVEREQEFRKIIDEHKGILFKVARMYCRDEEDRNDLVQEISIQVWRSLEKYNNKFHLSTWLYRISLNVAISFYRKNINRKQNTIPLNDQLAPSFETHNTDKEQQLLLLEKFINELKDLDKALMLLYLEDRSHSEIAEILGISISNVGTKVNRIKDKIKIKFSQVNLQ